MLWSAGFVVAILGVMFLFSDRVPRPVAGHERYPTGRFEGSVVTVTGAGNGIGRGVATAFAREGATVYGVDVDPRASERQGRRSAACGPAVSSA